MTPTPASSALAAAQLTIAQAFGVGGGSWTVTEPDGTARGTVTLYVRRIVERQPALSGIGFTTDTHWQAYGPLASLAADASSTGLWPGRIITSAADASLRYYVQDRIDTTRGIIQADVEPLT